MLRESFAIIFTFICFAVSTFLVAFNGINWSDSAQIFYFGNKIVHGAFPYRDFAYQTGFLSLWVDSVFQKWFGEIYLSSLLSGIALKFATLLVIYKILRQYSSQLISSAIICGLSFLFSDLIDGGNKYWAHFFILTSTGFILAALKNSNKRALHLFWILAGVSLSFVIITRQTNGILCFILALSVSTVHYFRRPEQPNLKKSFLCFWFGLVLGYLMILIFLAQHETVMQALFELFIAAVEKKNFNPFFAALDAFFGGTLFTASISRTLVKTALCNLVPLVFILSSLFSDGFSFDRRRISKMNSPTCLLWIPIVTVIGFFIPEIYRVLFHEDSVLVQNIFDVLTYDLLRVFSCFLLFLSVFFPKPTEFFFGISSCSVSFLSAIVLGSVWAMQISWMGRGYVEVRLLLVFIWLVVVMSERISVVWKKRLAVSFFVSSGIVLALQISTHSVGQEGIQSNFYKSHQHDLNHPIAKFVKVSREKSALYTNLKERIKPGDTCFIYGSAPILYLMLECQNPTNLDIAYSDSLTLETAQRAIASLNVNPPKWIIETGQLRYLDKDDFPRVGMASGPNQQPGPLALRSAMKSLISRYQMVLGFESKSKKQSPLGIGDLDHVVDFCLYQFSS